MRIVFTIFILGTVFFQSNAQDVAAMMKEVDRLEFVPNEKAAFAKCKEILKIQPLNIFALNKASELCSRIGKRQTVSKQSEDYYAAAKTYANIALKINPNNSESNCVMAIALGRSSLNKSGKEKIISAKEIKKHVDIAIKNDPTNFKAWHVLGRWNYEISTLNAFEKTAVKLLYGGLPPASLNASIAAFEKSNSLTDGFILNYLEMAKACDRNNQRDKAIALLHKMLTKPNQTEDDPDIKELGKSMLKQWRSF